MRRACSPMPSTTGSCSGSRQPPRQVDPAGHPTRSRLRPCRAHPTRWTTTRSSAAGERGRPRPPGAPVICGAPPARCSGVAAEKALGAHTYLVSRRPHAPRPRDHGRPTPRSSRSTGRLHRRDAPRPRAGQRPRSGAISTRPNDLDNFRWLGFSDADFEPAAPTASLDALVAVGDEEAVLASRVQEHLDVGATQVALAATRGRRLVRLSHAPPPRPGCLSPNTSIRAGARSRSALPDRRSERVPRCPAVGRLGAGFRAGCRFGSSWSEASAPTSLGASA